MAVRLREVLATLPGYVPGRSAPGTVKLASNETSYPPLPALLEAITDAAGTANRYPDNGTVALRTALADRFGVPTENVVAGGGSVALCTQLVQSVAGHGDQVMFAWRSFEAYPIITTVSGAEALTVPLTDHRHDLQAMAAAVTDRTRVIFVCNPNNPTGTVVGRDEVEALLDVVPRATAVVLDEAYFEFADSFDGMTMLAEHPNLVVLRTFSKAYGLAGLRVGYGVCADAGLAAAIRQTQVPFSISHVAQQAALAALEPEAEKQLLQRVDEVVAERGRVQHRLDALGYGVPPSEANFVWLPLGDRTVEWAAESERRGVIVRPFAGDGIRVTIGSPDENDLFLDIATALA